MLSFRFWFSGDFSLDGANVAQIKLKDDAEAFNAMKYTLVVSACKLGYFWAACVM